MHMFDQHPNPESHHRVTVLFLHPASSSGFRAKLEEWVADRLVHNPQSASFLNAIAGFRLVPLTEESAERPHGIIKKSTTMKPSKAMRGSLAIRWREINEHLRHFLKQLFSNKLFLKAHIS